MMKYIIFTGALVLASSMSGEAMADCSTNRVNLGNNLNTLLSGKTACDASAKYDTRPKHPELGIVTMGIQEEHHSDGTLWDFKCGPAGYTGSGCLKPDTDRKRQVGTWTASNGSNAAVTYTYDASTTSGPYQVYSTGGNGYDFCSGTTVVASVTLVSTGAGTSRVCP